MACRIDGSRDPAAIAELVSGDLGRSLTADQVRHLITAKLRPWASSPPRAPRPPRRGPTRCSRCGRGARCCPNGPSNAAGTLLRPLFRPPVVAAVIVSVLAVD